MNSGRFVKGQAAWNKVPWVKKTCPKCKSEFEVKPSLVRVAHCSRRCARIGETSGAKGKKFGPAHNRGVPLAEEVKSKIRAKMVLVRGPEHPNWRGGKRSERKRAMARHEYREWREAVFNRDDFTCQWCGVRGVTLHADHIEPWSESPSLRFEVANGRALCVTCHRKTPSYPKQFIPRET